MTLLIQRAGPALSETCQNYAQRINKSAEFMDAMLIDMLAFSRISQQRLELVPVKLGNVVASVLTRLQQDIQSPNLRPCSKRQCSKRQCRWLKYSRRRHNRLPFSRCPCSRPPSSPCQ